MIEARRPRVHLALVGGQGDEASAPESRIATKRLGHRETVELWHAEIADDDVGHKRAGLLDGLDAVERNLNAVPAHSQDGGERFGEIAVVINHENALRAALDRVRQS